MGGLHEARGSQSATSQDGTVESEASDSCGHSSGYKSSGSSRASYDGSDTVCRNSQKKSTFITCDIFFWSRIGIVLMYTLDNMFVAVIKTKKIVLIQISHPNGHVYSNLS